jgi:RNA polymerase sigma factor (sigma-70 family)
LAALASGARDGKHEATRTLIAAVMPALLRAARGVLGARHLEIEDVAQEAALGFVRALPDYRKECTVLHFATRVSVLTALAARRRLRSRGFGNHVTIDEDTLSTEPSPAEALVAARRRQLLRELCDELPEAQGEALVLHCVLGLTLDEIAGAGHLPRNTVRSRLRLAKEALRNKLDLSPELRDALEGDL